jgi:hypothetical protein
MVAGALRAVLPGVRLIAALFPKQGNCFAFAITKVRDLHPWMKDEVSVDEDWVNRRYSVERLVAVATARADG